MDRTTVIPLKMNQVRMVSPWGIRVSIRLTKNASIIRDNRFWQIADIPALAMGSRMR